MTSGLLFSGVRCCKCGAWESLGKRFLVTGPTARVCWDCCWWPPCAVCGVEVRQGVISGYGLTHDECAERFDHGHSKIGAEES